MRRIAIALTISGVVVFAAAAAYAQGCQQGMVWCCKRTPSGGQACSCQYLCN
jgi:hypothetical protein